MAATGQGGSMPKRLLIAPDRLNEDLTFQALRQLQVNPKLSQRQLAPTGKKALGISRGKTNDCLRAPIARGLVKAESFRTSNNKLGYAYLLTAAGIETKTRITARFLQRKRAEYDALKAELEQLTAEAEAEKLCRLSDEPKITRSCGIVANLGAPLATAASRKKAGPVPFPLGANNGHA